VWKAAEEVKRPRLALVGSSPRHRLQTMTQPGVPSIVLTAAGPPGDKVLQFWPSSRTEFPLCQAATVPLPHKCKAPQIAFFFRCGTYVLRNSGKLNGDEEA